MPSDTPSETPASPAPEVKVYRGYSQAELDAQYNQATLVPDISGYLDAWDGESARVRDSQPSRLSVPYGDGPAETLDIFPAENGADGVPVMLFIHGGAWRALSKDSFSYPAAPFAAAGAAWVVADFSLLPEVSLDEQVRQNRAALVWLWRNARGFGGDPGRLYVCGHSSGAHVGGTLIQDGWRARAGLPEDVIKGRGAGQRHVRPGAGAPVGAQRLCPPRRGRGAAAEPGPQRSGSPAPPWRCSGAAGSWTNSAASRAASPRSCGRGATGPKPWRSPAPTISTWPTASPTAAARSCAAASA